MILRHVVAPPFPARIADFRAGSQSYIKPFRRIFSTRFIPDELLGLFETTA